jgi:zinc protease
LCATYSPGVSSSMSDLYPNRGVFSISVGGDPKDLAIIESTVDRVEKEMLTKAIEPDLFMRARQPVIESFVNWKQNNSTWAGIVSIAQSKPDRLDRFRKHEAAFRALTATDVKNVAREFLNRPADFTFRSLPRAESAKN